MTAGVNRDDAAAALNAVAASQHKIAERVTIPWSHFVAVGVYMWAGQVLPYYGTSTWGAIAFQVLTASFLLLMWVEQKRMRLVLPLRPIPRRWIVAFGIYVTVIVTLFALRLVLEFGAGASENLTGIWIGGVMALITVAFGLSVNRALAKRARGVSER